MSSPDCGVVEMLLYESSNSIYRIVGRCAWSCKYALGSVTFVV